MILRYLQRKDLCHYQTIVLVTKNYKRKRNVRVLCFRRGVVEAPAFVGYDAASMGHWNPTFRGTILSSTLTAHLPLTMRTKLRPKSREPINH
jgi:hypothetical protein